MLLAPIVSRLQTQVTALRHVGAAATLEQAIADMKMWPCAYLLAPREQADGNELINAVSQRVADRFGVLLAVRNVSDAAGDAAYAELDGLRPSIKASLLNWVPATGHDPIEYTGGQLLYAANGLLVWGDEFTTVHYLRA
jgi:hypothetical protein